MGACCGKETQIVVGYNNHTTTLNNITSIDMLIQKAKTNLKVTDNGTFSLFLNKGKLTSDNQLAQACRSSSKVILTLVKDEVAKLAKDNPLFSVSQQITTVSRGDIQFSAVLITPKYILVPKAACPSKQDVSSLSVTVSELKKPLKLQNKVFIEISENLVILELAIDETTEEILATRPKINFNTNEIKQSEAVNALFYPKGKSQIQIDKSKASPFDVNHFQLSKSLPNEAQGGLITNNKGDARGIILESQGGKGNALSIRVLVDQIEQMAREGSSRTKRVCNTIAEHHGIDLTETKEEVIVTLKEKEKHEEEFEGFQMISTQKKNTVEAEEEVVEDHNVEVNLNFQMPAKKDLQYLEAGLYVNPLSNKLVAYHPSEFSVNHFDLLIDLKKDFTMTQTSIGVVIVSGKQAWLWDTDVFLPLNPLKEIHKKHTACVYNNSLVVISGKDMLEVESLNLHSMIWKTLPGLSKPREYAASFSVANSMYVLGGIKHEKVCNSILKYRNSWEKLSFKLPERLSQLGVVGLESNFIIFGGFNSEGGENPNAWEINYLGTSKDLGQIPVKGNFWGHQAGKFEYSYTYCTRNARIMSYDSRRKKFYLVSIGNNDESFMISS